MGKNRVFGGDDVTAQQIITQGVFAGFSVWFLGQPLKWNHHAGFVLIVGATALMFYRPARMST